MNQTKKDVSLIRCETYQYETVRGALEKCIANLGGLERYLDKGKTVLLKVNLLMKRPPDAAVTTHPAFVRALADILIEYGMSVVIGDSPGGPFTEGALRGIYQASGMIEVAELSGAKLNFNTASFKRGEMLMVDMLNDADYVISVSKLKTHGMMTFTGAVKNLFGTIPGTYKAQYHVNYPKHDDFADALLDICIAAKPVLSFMDGIVGMEGAGPSGGTPRKMNVVAASNSPYALDKVVIGLIGLGVGDVPTVRRSVARGLTAGDLSDICLHGEAPSKFTVKDFDIPPTRTIFLSTSCIPKVITQLTAFLLQPKPVFDHSLCIGCGDCAKNCPPKVIEMVDHKPQVDYEGCIRCFCCQELCPKIAVSIYRPPLMRMMSK